MGCAASKDKMGPTAGNLLVDGFLRYVNGTQGWTKVRSASGRKELHLEVYQADEPLGTWRGSVVLDGVDLQDILSFVKFKLGTDSFELLETVEDEGVYRDIFDFKDVANGNASAKHKVAGDHRGEMAERMDDSIFSLENPRKTNLADFRPKASSFFDAALGKINSIKETAEPRSKPKKHKDQEGQQGQDSPPDSSVDSENDDHSDSEEESKASVEQVEEVTDSQVDSMLLEAQSESQRGTWGTRLFASKTSATTSGKTSKSKASDPNAQVPAPREMIFTRQDYALGQTRAVAIAQSTKYNKSRSAIGAKRCTMHMMGVLIEEFMERKKPRVKLTFICSIDPNLAEWEEPLATEEALSLLGGKLRVENFLLDVLKFFSKPQNRLIQKFRYTAGASTGQMGWEEVERSKNELQLGTNVRHPTYGHGVVQSFDMKGRVRVAYAKETIDHNPDEKDDLRVAVIIGTRVQHPDRGYGTVKAFDEMGRIHVKFDNGEMHRYKQAAWKKKMHTVRLMGIGGALGTVRLSWRPFEGVREGMGRVKFAVGVSTDAVLTYILKSNSSFSDEEIKSGTIIERRVVSVLNDHERIIYEHRKMPPPLTSRDFVFKEIWSEVAPKTFVVVYENTTVADIPDKPQVVRGEIHLSGWLLEPLYLDGETHDDEDHICRITYQMCMDAKGFIAPDAVDAVRSAQLLAGLTDCRAYFWTQSENKANMKLRSRQSKRLSGVGVSETPKLSEEVMGGMKRIASKLVM